MHFSFYSFLLFLLILLVPRKYFHCVLDQYWMYCFLAGNGCEKLIIPESDGGPYLYMFNHVSMFDQFMIGVHRSLYNGSGCY